MVAPMSEAAKTKLDDAIAKMLADPEKLRKECDDAARAEHPEMTEEQLDWSWRQAAHQLGLEE